MSILDSLPSDPSARRKLILAVSIIGICSLWMIYFVSTQFDFRGPARAPSSAGWTAAQQINAKLNSDHAFSDVGVGVLKEKPLKYIVNGGVYKQDDLDRLPEVLKSIKPDAEYELHVELLKK
jgi:hypothetical protein